MKILMLSLLMVVSLSQASFAVVGPRPGQGTDLYSCQIDRTYTLIIHTRPYLPMYQLRLMAFNNPNPVATLDINSSSVTSYGSAFIIFENLGRSGYAFIRIDQSSPVNGHYRGVADINIFGPNSELNTHGLKDVYCQQYMYTM